jgi:RNA polymerase sigma-70 factor (ECF subfamily)
MEAGYGELVRSVAAGGSSARDAETAVCREFAPRIRLYGLRHLRDEDRAADLVQVVLMATIEALRAGRVEEPEHLDRFVLGICRNTVHRLRDGDARVVSRPNEEIDLGSVMPDTERLDTVALFRCIAALDSKPRAVLYLTFQHEESSEEIATKLGTTTANVRVLRHRAVAQVRACLDSKGAA